MTHRAIAVGPASVASLVAAAVATVVMFAWPLFAGPQAGATVGHTVDAPYLFIAILPLIIALVLAQLSEGGMDVKALAMLGILAALTAALRPLGAGVGGVETMFFLLVLAGRVFGAGFGLALGVIAVLVSALLTGGVGPWLPFQMMAAGWVGFGAGLLPRRARGWVELLLVGAYGALAAFAFGLVMNMWFWPFLAGSTSQGGALGYVPGAGIATNLAHFWRYSLVTSFVWDAGRAVTTVILTALLGPAALVVLRRGARRARFGTASARTPKPTHPSEVSG